MRLNLSTLNLLRGALAPSGTAGQPGVVATAPLANAPLYDKIELPTYDPKHLSPGIVHIGVGNFHRSHFAAYMNDLLNDPTEFESHKAWGIVGAALKRSSPKRQQVLREQDWLQTLVERDGKSAKASILAPMIDFTTVDYENTYGSGSSKPWNELLLDPNIKMVSLCITEGGYFMLNTDNQDDDAPLLDVNDPEIQQDIKNPEYPQTAFGIIIRAFKKRREFGMAPFTVVCCDNIPGNGRVTRKIVTELAAQMFPNSGLAEWIDINGAFPNGMVDRITPAVTNDMIDFVRKEYGFEDASPVFCEPFRQWVLEDDFVNGERPAWEKCETVMFVDDVHPYELMKIRILNGGHASLCYPSALLGLKYVHDAMEHPVVGPFLDKLERTEIIPTVPPVPNTDLEVYWDIIAERFSNPTIMDTIERNCFDGSSRQPKFITPVVSDALRKGGADACVDGLALVSAMWCRYCQGTTEVGERIKPNAPNWDVLQQTARKAKSDPTVWLDSNSDVYGAAGVGDNPIFREAFTKAMKSIEEKGVEATMKSYIES